MDIHVDRWGCRNICRTGYVCRLVQGFNHCLVCGSDYHPWTYRKIIVATSVSQAIGRHIMEPHIEFQSEEIMAMIKCSECGRDISDTATACVGCGAPMAVAAAKSDRSAMFGLNGLKTAVSSATARVKESAESVAKSDSGSKVLTGLKSAVSTVTAKAKETAEAAAEHGKEMMKSKHQKDRREAHDSDQFERKNFLFKSKSHQCTHQ